MAEVAKRSRPRAKPKQTKVQLRSFNSVPQNHTRAYEGQRYIQYVCLETGSVQFSVVLVVVCCCAFYFLTLFVAIK